MPTIDVFTATCKGELTGQKNPDDRERKVFPCPTHVVLPRSLVKNNGTEYEWKEGEAPLFACPLCRRPTPLSKPTHSKADPDVLKLKRLWKVTRAAYADSMPPLNGTKPHEVFYTLQDYSQTEEDVGRFAHEFRGWQSQPVDMKLADIGIALEPIEYD